MTFTSKRTIMVCMIKTNILFLTNQSLTSNHAYGVFVTDPTDTDLYVVHYACFAYSYS